MSGANGAGGSNYQPHETSYDYDSPISEGGEHGYHAGQDKYAMLQTVFAKYAKDQPPAEPDLPNRSAYGTLPMTQFAPLLTNIQHLSPQPASQGSTNPPFAESVGCFYGFVMYSTLLPAAASQLTLNGVRDRALVFVDGKFVDTVYRVTSPDGVQIQLPEGTRTNARLQVLVENMGRINFSHGMDNTLKGTFVNGSATVFLKDLRSCVVP